MKDLDELLKGSGTTTRHIVLTEGAKMLSSPIVHALVEQALANAGHPFAAGGKGRIVIKSVLAKQHPSRPASA